jgi:hypothetical protein
MLKKLKRNLVQSYVGAIGLGYLLAHAVLYLVGAFTSPIAKWLGRREYGHLIEHQNGQVGFSLQDALPDLAGFLVLLLVWYFLMRWLYFKPIEERVSEGDPS